MSGLTINRLPCCIGVAELCGLSDRQLRCCCRFEDVEIKEEEVWSEAGGRGVHGGEQTAQSRGKVSLHAYEERDEVSQLLEAVGQTNITAEMKIQNMKGFSG